MDREQFLSYLTLDGWEGCSDDSGAGIKKLNGGECYWLVGRDQVMYSPTYSIGSAIAACTTDIRDTPVKFLRLVAEKMGVHYEP